MKVRIPKSIYDDLSNFAERCDITLDEAIVICFIIPNDEREKASPAGGLGLFGHEKHEEER
tara:strand:- start:14664 stop:14846 length:183 start_codon:yes stop_codon:yes gene_type:complete